ncbi:MAG: sulfite exporter TauE/SafE family protein [Flavobacteriales bacterium]|nr:sulfite exporter TauE/SafE family protein [Flavobacteriales bacterium]MCB9167433.1 sulfite exporter TauE/SafE family protein [Flavobacteriales bacterium]MCB9171036.1 sulfite exporter TauE/SafE family protein [Flavobacteriales bacterium]
MIQVLLPALLLGMLGSVHCVGMCGPIALAVPRGGRGAWAAWRSTVLLNGGRVFTYALMGAAFGTFGRGLAIAGLQRSVSIAVGVLILIVILFPWIATRFSSTALMARSVQLLQGYMARWLKRTSTSGLLVTGALNGLLPCGLVYMAVAGALGQDTWQRGALFMVAFGLGTWPALFLVRLGGGWLTGRARAHMRALVPVVMAAMGVLFILRGLGLGIPYISPDIDHAPMQVEACH